MKQIKISIKQNSVAKLLLSVLLCILLQSCKDFIAVDPPSNQLITETVFEDELTAKAALLGLYAKMSFNGGPAGGAVNGISNLAGLSSDELTITNTSDLLSQFYENNILSSSPIITNVWNPFYDYIYSSNSLIDGLDKSTKLPTSLQNQFKGEAIFLRAYSHFYLVNLFGKVPYITSTDYESNSKEVRQEINDVYSLLVKDLLLAKELMAKNYSFSDGRRTRATSMAASALLARVFLFMGKNAEAEAEATLVIDNPLFSLEDVENVFLVSSNEAIWQLGNREIYNYTNDGAYFAGTGSKFEQSLTDNLITSFEGGDLRRTKWIQELELNGKPIFGPYKYKDNTTSTALNERYAMLRLGEQLLIRAEARARQSRFTGTNSAASDLNRIRVRAGLSPVPTMTGEATLNAILKERRHELFTEMGSRWLDLKRFGIANQVLSTIKADWQSTDELYPIPYEETLVNKNLVQNPGYN